jgi:hypothetical protein
MPHVNELHAQHDPILVVSLASGDLATADRDFATASSLVESCADCARLHDDVLAVARATKALPPAVRTRDFRISPEQAAKLRPAGWRRFVAGLAAPGGLFSRQVGVGLATLGIAGLLVTALPSMPLGMSGAAASPAPNAAAPAYESLETDDTNNFFGPAAAPSAAPSWRDQETTTLGGAASPPAASAAPELDTSGSSPAVTTSGEAAAGRSNATINPLDAADGQATPEPVAQAPAAPMDSGSPGGPSGLAIASTVLLLAGLVLLIGRRMTRGASSN